MTSLPLTLRIIAASTTWLSPYNWSYRGILDSSWYKNFYSLAFYLQFCSYCSHPAVKTVAITAYYCWSLSFVRLELLSFFLVTISVYDLPGIYAYSIVNVQNINFSLKSRPCLKKRGYMNLWGFAILNFSERRN